MNWKNLFLASALALFLALSAGSGSADDGSCISKWSPLKSEYVDFDFPELDDLRNVEVTAEQMKSARSDIVFNEAFHFCSSGFYMGIANEQARLNPRDRWSKLGAGLAETLGFKPLEQSTEFMLDRIDPRKTDERYSYIRYGFDAGTYSYQRTVDIEKLENIANYACGVRAWQAAEKGRNGFSSAFPGFIKSRGTKADTSKNKSDDEG